MISTIQIYPDLSGQVIILQIYHDLSIRGIP